MCLYEYINSAGSLCRAVDIYYNIVYNALIILYYHRRHHHHRTRYGGTFRVRLRAIRHPGISGGREGVAKTVRGTSVTCAVA